MNLKNLLKKAGALLVAGAMTLSNLTGLTAYAEGTGSIYAENVTAHPGKSVDVQFCVKNNPGFTVIKFEVEYDAETLKLTKNKIGDIVSEDASAPVSQANGKYTISIGNDYATENATADGVLYTLTFDVNASAAVGVYPITMSFKEAFDTDLRSVNFSASGAKVTVTCDHQGLKKVDAKAPTCSEDGNNEYYFCDTCGKAFKDAGCTQETTPEAEKLGKLSHTLSSHPAREATCTEAGNSAYWSCADCGKFFSDAQGNTEIEANSWDIPATGHTMTAHAAKDATCTEDGNSAYWSCAECGKFFADADGNNEIEVDSWVIPAAHKLTAHAAKEATCTEAGNSAYWSCADCGKFFSDAQGNTEIEANSWDIPATGHTMTAHAAKDATCTEDGNSAYWSCADCGKYFADAQGNTEIEANSWVIPATGHTMTAHAANDANCENAGNSAYWSCDECGKFFADADGKNEIEADSWVIPAAHKLTAHAAKEATCTEDGNSAYWSCSVCGKFFSDADGKNEIEDGNWVSPKKGHTLTTHGAKAATCTEAGNSAYWSCSVCHKYFADDAGTNEMGKDSWILPAIGHNMTAHAANAADCEHAGNSAYWSCDKCGKFFSDADGKNEIEADSWVIPAAHKLTAHAAKEATCTEAGNSAYWTCSVCHKYFSDATGKTEIAENAWVIPAKGHTMTEHAATDSTYDQAGNKAYWSCSACGKYFSDADGKNEVAAGSWVILPKVETAVTVSGTDNLVGAKINIANAVLTKAEQAAVSQGQTITIRFNVDKKATVTNNELNQVKEKSAGYAIGSFFDIGINKSIGGAASTAVHETSEGVEIQLTLPANLINTNQNVRRTYKVVRIHIDPVTGQTTVDVLDANYHAGYNKLVFKSDKFSTYAVIYTDTPINVSSVSQTSGDSHEKGDNFTGKICPVCGYNNCTLGSDFLWHCGKCSHSWAEYGQVDSTGKPVSKATAPKSPKTGQFD